MILVHTSTLVDIPLSNIWHANLVFYYIIYYHISKINAIKNCQVLVKKLNFMAGMTPCFISAKRIIRYFSNFGKLVEHCAQTQKGIWMRCSKLLEFAQNRKYLMSVLAETKRCIIPATKFKVKLILLDTSSIFTNILKYPIQSECKPPVCSISIIDLWVFSLRLGLGLQIWIQIKDDLLHSTTNESLGVLLCYALWIHWYPVISPPGSFATNWLATKKK